VELPEVVGALNRAGFGDEDICMVLSPAHPVADAMSIPKTLDVPHEESASVIRWLSKFGAVVIPTVGFFARSQAFLEALLGEQNFPSLSRGSRTLLGLGFSHDDAKRLGRQLSDVAAMVYVACPESGKADSAIELLRQSGAREAAKVGAMKVAAAAA
jgi:hypothetical protein